MRILFATETFAMVRNDLSVFAVSDVHRVLICLLDV